MNAGTKVFLAVIALLVGAMILYYGVLQPGDHPTPAKGGTTGPEAPMVRGAPPVEPGGANVQPVTRNENRTTGGDHHAGAPNTIPPATDPLADLGTQATSNTAGFLTDTLTQTPADSTSGSAAGGGSEGVIGNGATRSNSDETVQPNRSGSTSHEGSSTPRGGTSAQPEIKPTTVTPRHTDVLPLFRPGLTPNGGNTGSNPNAVRPTSTPPRPSEGVEYTWYTIKQGDTGVSIAEAWFGDGDKWKLISKANPMVDFKLLQIGQKLRLPPKDAAKEAANDVAKKDTSTPLTGGKPVTESSPTDLNTYIVKSGDTLTSIARTKYGDGALWELIYEANKRTIGDDPGALKIDMKLTIPAKHAR